MLIEYFEKFNLRINDFDCHDRILMSSILDIFQDVAGKHATKLGVGFHDLLKKNRIWVVVRTKFDIYKQPKQEETVIVRTWPLPLGKIDANRCYEIRNELGELLIRGVSKWVTVDINSRRVVRMNEISYGEGEFDEDYGLLEDFSKVNNFESNSEVIKIKPQYLDLDHNGHINNSKYTNFVLNNVKELHDKEIIFCQMEHIQELKKDEEFTLSYLVNEKECLAKGETNNGISFITKIYIK